MDLPKPREGALAQPTRARIFAFLAEKRAPAGTEELAEHFGLHPNGVRRHLERLREDGLVARSRVRAGPGRPRDSWSIASGARPEGERPRGYADLARWLARAIPSGPARLREVERTGREIGRELVPTDPDDHSDPAETFRQAFAALGFEPELDVKTEGGFTCRLENCPFRDSVRESADVICTLHRGITAGLLAELAPEAKLLDFEPREPVRAGCLIEVSGAAPG